MCIRDSPPTIHNFKVDSSIHKLVSPHMPLTFNLTFHVAWYLLRRYSNTILVFVGFTKGFVPSVNLEPAPFSQFCPSIAHNIVLLVRWMQTTFFYCPDYASQCRHQSSHCFIPTFILTYQNIAIAHLSEFIALFLTPLFNVFF